jgi:hypothetical protein
MIRRQSTETSTQGATPTRSLLFLPSRVRAPSGALRLTPFSLCRLRIGTTMREVVTSDRSVKRLLSLRLIAPPQAGGSTTSFPNHIVSRMR